jgi:hypothetical protein
MEIAKIKKRWNKEFFGFYPIKSFPLNLYCRSSLSPIVDTAHLSDVIFRSPDSFAVLDPEIQSLDASTLSNGSAQ